MQAFGGTRASESEEDSEPVIFGRKPNEADGIRTRNHRIDSPVL